MIFYDPEKRDAYLKSVASGLLKRHVNQAVESDWPDYDLNPEIRKFRMATLVITGRYDMNVAPVVAWKIHHAVPGSRFVVFERSSHLPFYEEPERFKQVAGGVSEPPVISLSPAARPWAAPRSPSGESRPRRRTGPLVRHPVPLRPEVLHRRVVEEVRHPRRVQAGVLLDLLAEAAEFSFPSLKSRPQNGLKPELDVVLERRRRLALRLRSARRSRSSSAFARRRSSSSAVRAPVALEHSARAAAPAR